MATNLNVTELDFDDIKQNLKNYLKQQTIFNDYDFDGAGLNVLLDVLAYNTHYNAMAAHLSLNEAFLDSAQIRGNAVSRARMLGYVPKSELAPRGAVTVVVNVASETGTIPSSLTMPRGTKLSTTVGGLSYRFVTLDSATTTKIGNTFTFTNVAIAEGSYNSNAPFSPVPPTTPLIDKFPAIVKLPSLWTLKASFATSPPNIVWITKSTCSLALST